MPYSTLLVHLDAGGSNAHVLDVAANLAKQFTAKIIGVAASRPIQIGTLGDDSTGQLVAMERDAAEGSLKLAEAEFRACAAIQPYILEWRSLSTMDPIAHVLAEQARSADLLIASARPGPESSAERNADVGELIVRAGRPVLVVPESPAPSRFDKIVIAWAETRECRRALVDALPFLVAADEVAVVAAEEDAELIVAGAYGHNRLREWAFGGVTRDLLLRANRCALLSH